MEERRKFKSINTDEGREIYKKLNKELRWERDRAREKWWKGKCQDLQDLDRKGRTHIYVQQSESIKEKEIWNSERYNKRARW